LNKKVIPKTRKEARKEVRKRTRNKKGTKWFVKMTAFCDIEPCILAK
jgi:hypothetical protein